MDSQQSTMPLGDSQQSATMPGGGWRQTARNVAVADGTLTAELQKVDGSWVEASVELAGDSSQYDNIDGAFAPAQPSDNIDYDVASWYRTEEGLEYPHGQQDQESQAGPCSTGRVVGTVVSLRDS